MLIHMCKRLERGCGKPDIHAQECVQFFLIFLASVGMTVSAKPLLSFSSCHQAIAYMHLSMNTRASLPPFLESKSGAFFIHHTEC